MDKEKLLHKCVALINDKLENIQQAIQGYQEDLNSETKSSAGDKHETGRAMLQLEMEKLGKQYQTVLLQKESLQQIDISPKAIVQIGSLVKANGFYYFLATSVGQVKIEGEIVMVISIHSPIGQLLLGKQESDVFVFNGKEFFVESVL